MMGGLYGVPIVTGVPFVLYYNQDILDSIGEKLLRHGKTLLVSVKKLQKTQMAMVRSISTDML